MDAGVTAMETVLEGDVGRGVLEVRDIELLAMLDHVGTLALANAPLVELDVLIAVGLHVTTLRCPRVIRCSA
jgi:hypothetical protein